MPVLRPNLHPEVQAIWEQHKKRLEELYQPVLDVSDTARGAVGNVAAEYAAGDLPQQQQASRRMAQTIFDLLMPDVRDPYDMALTLMPAITKTGAFIDMGADIAKATKKAPNEAILRELIDYPTGVVKPSLWGPMGGPFPDARIIDSSWGHGGRFRGYSQERWMDDQLVEAGQPIIQPGTLHYDPKDVGKGIHMVSGENPVKQWWLTQMLRYGEDAPLRRHQAGMAHEFGHEAAQILGEQGDYARVFGAKRPEDLVIDRKLMETTARDWKHLRDLQKAGGTPPISHIFTEIHRPNYWWNANRINPLEELFADAFALRAMGHKPGTIYPEMIKDWGPIESFMNLENIRLKSLEEITGKPLFWWNK